MHSRPTTTGAKTVVDHKRNRGSLEEEKQQQQMTPSSKRQRGDVPVPPKGFLCPLTMEVIFDPVLDAEGNTYERSAILQWLLEHRTSPISRQPLSEKMLVPNNALREAIHEFMGPTWVLEQANKERNKRRERAEQTKSAQREKINSFLQFASKELGGSLSLSLNDKGCCAFRLDSMTVVIDVPDKSEMFCVYTRNLVLELTEPMKDLLLEMNFLQGDTRGGCLSVKKHDNQKSEVMFSYTDRVAEVSARDFVNIILNFLETAMNLRQKLLHFSDGAAVDNSINNNKANYAPETAARSLVPPQSINAAVTAATTAALSK